MLTDIRNLNRLLFLFYNPNNQSWRIKMRSIRLLLIASLLCIFSSTVSIAEQSDNAVAKNPKIDEKALQYSDAQDALAEKEYKKAIEILESLVAENYLPAKTLLGLLLFEGKAVEQDVVKGMSMVIEAANQGYEPAKPNAVALTGELAALGEPVAMYNAAYMCLNGWGGEQDPNTCVKLLEKAAESGHEKSVKFLSSIYTKGKYGIAPDKDKAEYWDKKLEE